MMTAQHSAELLLISRASQLCEKPWRFNEFVFEPLMITRVQVVIRVQSGGWPGISLVEEDLPAQTLLLDRAYKPFGARIARRNLGRAQSDSQRQNEDLCNSLRHISCHNN
jgi:hypothetical protein